MVKKRTVLAASKRVSPMKAKAVSDVAPNERIEVTVMLRPRSTAPSASARATSAMQRGAMLPERRTYLTHDELAAERGADPLDIAKLETFAHQYDLTLTQTNVAQRLVRLSGTIENLQRAFGAKLKNYKVGKLTFRGRTGSLSVPSDLADAIVGVYGFDMRPAAAPHFRVLGGMPAARRAAMPARKAANSRQKKSLTSSGAGSAPAASQLRPFTAPEVAKLYNFPTSLDGTGQCIAMIELNTPNPRTGKLGTGFSTPDLRTYFKKLKLPMPKVSAIGVGGGANLPGIDESDGEVMLDIEVAGAVAPAAQIAVYFGLNTSKGFIEATSAAVHDTVRKPSVISISWGGPEDPQYTSKQMRDGLSQVLEDAESLGITVCCASGDNGSSDLPKFDGNGKPRSDKNPHVDFPASSPFALACGGTTLVGSGTTIGSEIVWNEGDPASLNDQRPTGSGGGGVSNIFGKPAYQTQINIPKSPQGKTGRGVPDVAGNADSATGYLCKLAGIPQLVPIGGTSAVAPLWAGLLALVNQRLTKLGKQPAGLINPILYNSSASFHDITQGNNDIDGSFHKYAASPGWDACTGMGSPDGTKIMNSLGG